MESPLPSESPPPWLRRAIGELEQNERVDVLVDAVGPVAETVASGGRRPILEGRWLGHALHPLLTDLPLGCWLSATLVDLVGGKGGRRIARRLTGLGVVLAAPTAATGLAEWRLVQDHQTRRVGAVHALGGSLTTLLYAKSWLLRGRRPVRGAMVGMLAGGSAVATGYLGGHLSFVRGAGSGRRGWSETPRAPRGGMTSPADAIDQPTAVLDEVVNDRWG